MGEGRLVGTFDRHRAGPYSTQLYLKEGWSLKEGRNGHESLQQIRGEGDKMKTRSKVRGGRSGDGQGLESLSEISSNSLPRLSQSLQL